MTIKYPSFVFDMSDEEYHSTKEHLSSSGCKELIQNPLRWRLSQDQKFDRKPTDAMVFGSAVHAAILQPKNYENLVAIVPTDINRRTNVGKEEYAQFVEANKGKAFISLEQNNQIVEMQEAIGEHKFASELLGALSNCEVSAFFEVVDGVKGKARFDGLIIHEDIAVDLKTTKSAEKHQFMRSVAGFGYHIQNAFYADAYEKVTGRKLKAFYFVAIEKEPPYSLGVYDLSPEFIEMGRISYQKAATIMSYCSSNGWWPNYNKNELVTLEPPSWME